MAAHRFRFVRWLRDFASPMVLALPPLAWVAEGVRRASFTTLGRDQGVFQYVAWAIGRGEVDYRDVRDVNGPLTHWVHLVFLALGGGDEHRFRVLDLTVTALSFALVGACLPGIGTKQSPGPPERMAWAFAAAVVLGAQYIAYNFWDLAQRESFFDWFMLPSVALQLVAQAPRRPAVPSRVRAFVLFLAGALSIAPWFGKPTYALFSVLQCAALFADDAMGFGRKKAFVTFGLGAALSCAMALLFLSHCGDVSAFARIQFIDVPTMYRFIWPRTPAEILGLPWGASPAVYAFVGAVVLGILVFLGELPVRAISVVLLPLAALLGVVVQAKGFPYHFHPVTAAVHLQWLLFCAWLTDRARSVSRARALLRLLPIAGCAAVSVEVTMALQTSPNVRADWLVSGPADEERTTRAYFDQFPEPDFFPFEMRQTAAYLRAHTEPADRIQTYGMDPYVLFLAQRKSATPYIYAYDLDVDAALAGASRGGFDGPSSGPIRDIAKAHEADLLARITARPPAAFVFFDNAPLLSSTVAWDDFEAHCSRTAAWVHTRYRETARFGHDHVWLREDLAAQAEKLDQAPLDFEDTAKTQPRGAH